MQGFYKKLYFLSSPPFRSFLFKRAASVKAVPFKLSNVLKWISYKRSNGLALPFVYNSSVDALQKDIQESTKESKIKFEEISIKPIYIPPRNPIVLCHGLYGFDVRGPSSIPFLQIHYWAGIAEALRDIGAKVVISRVPSTGSIPNRALELHTLLNKSVKECEHDNKSKLNIVGHSMGGLDARFLISNILPKAKPKSCYSVDSLTTISTPHHGSPFMDWCREYLGLGKIYDYENNLFVPPNDLISSTQINERIADLIKLVVKDPKATPSNIQLKDISGNDERLSDFSGILNSIMLDKRMGDMNADKKEKHEISNSSDKQIVEDFSKLESKHVASTGWGVSGGSYLSQSVVLLRQLFERIMHLMDTPAYYCLTTEYCNQIFNPSTPPVDSVKYYSYGAKMDCSNKLNYYLNPLWFPHSIVYNAEGDNDGYVSLKSARYGQYIETVNCDHFSFTNRTRLSNLYKTVYPLVTFFHSLSTTKNSDLANQNLENPNKYDSMSAEFNPIEFYLKVATRLYNQGH